MCDEVRTVEWVPLLYQYNDLIIFHIKCNVFVYLYVTQPRYASFLSVAFTVHQYDIVMSRTPPSHWDVCWTPSSPFDGHWMGISNLRALRPEQKVK